MATPEQNYPENSIKGEMKVNIYAAKSNGDVTILHDKAFDPKLIELEFNTESRELSFIYEDHSRKPYGEQIRAPLAPYLEKADEVTFFLMDMATKKPLDMFTVPIKSGDLL